MANPLTGLGLGLLRKSQMMTREEALNPREKDLFDALITTNRLLFLLCLTAKATAGRFERAVTGDMIGVTDLFIPMYKNQSSYPLGVVIGGQFNSAAGRQIKLSLSQSGASSEVVDYLGNAASGPSFGKRISDPILLVPNQQLWINTADVNFALAAIDIFTVRIFDLAQYLSESAWQQRG